MSVLWDYAEEERRERLNHSQPMRWYVWPTWITGGLLVVVWARILYLAGCEAATWIVARIPQ